jgi:recombination endonuclease VII
MTSSGDSRSRDSAQIERPVGAAFKAALQSPRDPCSTPIEPPTPAGDAGRAVPAASSTSAASAYAAEWRRRKRENDPVWLEKLRERDRLAARKKRYRDVYGITLEDYDRMLEEQGGLCKVCRKPSEKPLVVDHCHVRGKVRGLMCDGCNHMLGHAHDDPDTLDAGAAFIVDFYSENPL